MKVLITGARGFIGKNLCFHLKENGIEVLPFDRENTEEDLKNYLLEADFIVHLAGINRPLKEEEFIDGNVNFTVKLLSLLKQSGRQIPLFFSSSTQAERDNPYGKSKAKAEEQIFVFGKETGNPVYVYRLYNVYGKWCRPSYNSVIATWCYNISRGIDIQINHDAPSISFVYIDDVCKEILSLIKGDKIPEQGILHYVEPHDDATLEEIASILYGFKASRDNYEVPDISTPFKKKLHATYLSYLEEDQFAYPLLTHMDSRGSFTEILRSQNNGQFSVNIINPGITKGNHYHHSKNEKFLVVKGKCLVQFRKIDESKIISYEENGSSMRVVDIPPGYTHSIQNIGKEQAIVFMWANEPFDENNPDTYPLMVK